MNGSALLDIVMFLLWLAVQLCRKEATVGFTPRASTLKIVFEEDTPLHGLVIRARPCTIGQWNDMVARAETDSELKGTAATAANDEFAEFFLSHVESWNLELTEGTVDPLTLETWHKLYQGWGGIIVSAWQLAMVSVPQSSPKSSSDGASSAERSLDLASLSESLPSWSEPN